MTLMWKEILEQADVLKKCLEVSSSINKIVEIITDSDIRYVVIAARGTSDHAAIFGKYLIEYKLGIPVSLAAPSIITTYDAAIEYKNCLVIAISQSGQAEDVLQVIRQARQKGSVTVGITNVEASPIANEVDFHIYIDTGPEKSVAATKTFTAQLMALAHFVSTWNNDLELLNELREIPGSLSEIFALSDRVEKLAHDIKKMDHCFILARGINYPIALEASLKLQETCYIEAKGFAISDFYHGPIAMVRKGSPVIVFAPQGVTFNDSKQIIEKLDVFGANLVIISNDIELINKYENTFMIPKTQNDIVSAFYNAVFSQMLACKLSLAKGLDPDNPRGLRKVTITV